MRSSTYQIAATLLMLGSQAMALDLSNYENTCADIGFKKKTPAFGECVLELHSREGKTAPVKQKQAQNAIGQGDGTPDHSTCAKYGFQEGTTEYSQCRMQIDIAKKEQAQNQARFEADQRRYDEEKRQYDERVAEFEKEKERRRGLAMMQFGAALASGTSRSFTENLANASRQSLGLAPTPPRRPLIQNFTITTPGGMRSCTVMGNNINCF
jgi:hypothetical protein